MPINYLNTYRQYRKLKKKCASFLRCLQILIFEGNLVPRKRIEYSNTTSGDSTITEIDVQISTASNEDITETKVVEFELKKR
jgi:hypothetical protein